MTEPATPPKPHHPWYTKLPAKLAAVVVFLVALTTLIGNLLELRRESATLAPPAVAPPVDAPVVAAPTPRAAVSDRVRLQLDRILVRHDGSLGTTDWRFTVEADDEPVLSFPLDDLDDTGGRNVVNPDGIQSVLRLADGEAATIRVRAWRVNRVRIPGGDADATGVGQLSGDGALAPITVVAAKPEDGEFVLRFSASRGD